MNLFTYGPKFLKSSLAALVIFNMGSVAFAQNIDVDAYNPKFEEAALMEAQAYLCGTDSGLSELAMAEGMKQTGLPEDIAVEIVSDLASVIIDAASKDDSAKFCSSVPVVIAAL